MLIRIINISSFFRTLPLAFAFSLTLDLIAVANRNIRLTLGYIGQLLLLP
jgi:hypothetical protein